MENQQLLFDWIGYIGSAFIVISMMMSSIIRLRWLNLTGAAIFATYGFIIGAMPVAFLNTFITVINIYHLYRIYSQGDFLKILHIRPENRYLEFFLDHYKEEINTYFPGFYESFKNKVIDPDQYLCFFILRNAAIAGVFAGKRLENKELLVEIDFTIPEYRDLKSGKYIYMQNTRYFENIGIEKFVADPRNRKHYQYLKKMGFREEPKAKGKVVLTLALA